MIYQILCELNRREAEAQRGKTSTESMDIMSAMVACQFGRPRRIPRRLRPPVFWRDIVFGLFLLGLTLLGCAPYLLGQ